jgi:hypothetical protein
MKIELIALGDPTEDGLRPEDTFTVTVTFSELVSLHLAILQSGRGALATGFQLREFSKLFTAAATAERKIKAVPFVEPLAQAAALKYFDTAWAALTQACGADAPTRAPELADDSDWGARARNALAFLRAALTVINGLGPLALAPPDHVSRLAWEAKTITEWAIKHAERCALVASGGRVSDVPETPALVPAEVSADSAVENERN